MILQCAIAFLLISGKGSNRLDRLIVTTNEVEKPSYGIYEVQDRGQFPQSEFVDASVFIKVKITQRGTYYMPYCSEYLTSVEIARTITEGLKDITHQAHVDLNHDPKKEKMCLQYLSTMSDPELEYNMIDISKCEEKVRRVCTSLIILNLAFKGIIAVDGPYKAFAPQMADQPIVVTLGQPVEMSSLVLNGEIFVKSGTVHERNALAWYQGYLHLFKQNLTTSEWSPVTLIGSEAMNGSLITNYVLKAIPKSKKQWMQFYKSKEDIIKSHDSLSLRSHSSNEKNTWEDMVLLSPSENYYHKLIRNYPFLDFTIEKYIFEFYSNSQNSLYIKFQNFRQLLQGTEKISPRKLIPFQAKGTMNALKEKVTTKT